MAEGDRELSDDELALAAGATAEAIRECKEAIAGWWNCEPEDVTITVKGHEF
jgi:hypothetical protein